MGQVQLKKRVNIAVKKMNLNVKMKEMRMKTHLMKMAPSKTPPLSLRTIQTKDNNSSLILIKKKIKRMKRSRLH